MPRTLVSGLGGEKMVHARRVAPNDGLQATSKNFIVAVALCPQEKPVTAVDELKRGVRKEYPVKYLEEIGAVATPQNIALVEKEMGIDNRCKVSAAWKSRGSVHDCLYVAPKFPNQTLDAGATDGGGPSRENVRSSAESRSQDASPSSDARGRLRSASPIDFAVVDASLARQAQQELDKISAQRYVRPQGRAGRREGYQGGRSRRRLVYTGRAPAAGKRQRGAKSIKSGHHGDDDYDDGDADLDSVEARLAFLDAKLGGESDEYPRNLSDSDDGDGDGDPSASVSQHRRRRPVGMTLRFATLEELKADLAALDVLNGAQAMPMTVPRSNASAKEQASGQAGVVPLTAAMMEEMQRPFAQVFHQQRAMLEKLSEELNELCVQANLGSLIRVQPLLKIVQQACALVLREVILERLDAEGLAGGHGIPDAAASRAALAERFRRYRTAESLFATRVLVDAFFFAMYRNTLAELARHSTKRAKEEREAQRERERRQRRLEDGGDSDDDDGEGEGTGREHYVGTGLEDAEFALRERLRRQEQHARSTELSKLYNPARCEIDAVVCSALDNGMLLRLSPGLSGHTTRRLPSLKAICGHGQGSTQARLLRLKSAASRGPRSKAGALRAGPA